MTLERNVVEIVAEQTGLELSTVMWLLENGWSYISHLVNLPFWDGAIGVLDLDLSVAKDLVDKGWIYSFPEGKNPRWDHPANSMVVI